MKLRQYPPVKPNNSDRWKWRFIHERPKVFQHQRFAFGEPIDDGVSYYKYKYVCFHCRKMFRPPDRSMRKEKCPECGGPVRFIGTMFKTPRRNDKRSWKKLQDILR